MTLDFGGFRPSRIWKRLPQEQRLAAAQAFWLDEESADQQVEAVAAIAARMKFRAKTVLGLSPERRVKYLATLPTISDSIAARALVNYHLSLQRPMMAAFLDRLGVSHDNGLITEEQVAKPEAEKLRAAAAELQETHAVADAALYFATLVSQDPDTWGDLAALPALQPGGVLPLAETR